MELARGIRHPGSVVVENLARGELEVQELIVTHKARVAATALKDLDIGSGVRIGSISRGGKTWIAGANDRFEVDDRITLIGTREEIDDVKGIFGQGAGKKLGVVIAGGGETGFHLARILEGQRFNVVLIEADRDRCDFLSKNLKYSTVVHSDATRRANLEEERVGTADVFVACIGDDENNIMAGVEANDIGAKSVMAIVHRPDYAHVVGKLGITLAVSPRSVMAKQVLGFLNSGPVISRTSLGDGSITVLEIEVLPGTPATEHVLARLDLPPKCLIAAVMQEEFARVPGADDHLGPGDTVVALVEDSVVDDVIKVFSTNGT
jgi:trk system potassium uptake protein TrkA